MIKRSLFRISVWMLALVVSQGAYALQSFDAAGTDEIKDRYAQQTVLLLVWSVGCQHCKDGMRQAGAKLGEEPGLNLVLLNVDRPDDVSDVERELDRLGLSDVDNWQFTDAPPARLRAALDPDWFGELPRSYLITPDGSMHGVSGPLSQELLDHWVRLSRGQSSDS